MVWLPDRANAEVELNMPGDRAYVPEALKKLSIEWRKNKHGFLRDYPVINEEKKYVCRTDSPE